MDGQSQELTPDTSKRPTTRLEIMIGANLVLIETGVQFGKQLRNRLHKPAQITEISEQVALPNPDTRPE